MKRWLHYFRRSLQILVPVALAVFSARAAATDTPIAGAAGGKYFRATCDAGSYLVGFSGRTGAWIDQIAPVCEPLLADRQNFGKFKVGQTIGTSSGGTADFLRCPHGSVVGNTTHTMTVGDSGQPKFVQSMAVECYTTAGKLSGPRLTFGHPSYWSAFTSTPDPVLSACPNGEFARGFHGRSDQFISAFGLICGPLEVVLPPKPGVISPSQAKNISSALPTAPTINSPQGFIVKGKGIFKITPSPYLTGTQAQIQLKWLNPPANLKGKGVDFYNYESPASLIASPAGIAAPDTYLSPGTWEMRVRINQPKAGDWSEWRRFEYYLQDPAVTTLPKAFEQKIGTGTGSKTTPTSRVGAAIGGSQCNAGFVYRLAGPSDHICVTPESSQRAKQENASAATRRNPGGGAYGPNTCLAGFVWREAFAGDTVCVTPAVRQTVRQENQLHTSRSTGATQLSPK